MCVHVCYVDGMFQCVNVLSACAVHTSRRKCMAKTTDNDNNDDDDNDVSDYGSGGAYLGICPLLYGLVCVNACVSLCGNRRPHAARGVFMLMMMAMMKVVALGGANICCVIHISATIKRYKQHTDRCSTVNRRRLPVPGTLYACATCTHTHT